MSLKASEILCFADAYSRDAFVDGVYRAEHHLGGFCICKWWWKLFWLSTGMYGAGL